MNHPVVIITSDPEGVQHAVQHLQVEGYEVKVLDSLSANLIDFFGALSSTDPEQFSTVDDSMTPEDPLATEPATAGSDSLGGGMSSDTTTSADGQTFQGTIDDEPIEVHEVDGGDLVLHPVSLSGDGAKKKFKLSEEVEISVNFGFLTESEHKSKDEPNTVKVHFVVEELGIDADVDVMLSDMVMTPPVIMMGKDWFAQHTTGASPDAMPAPTNSQTGTVAPESVPAPAKTNAATPAPSIDPNTD